MPSVTVTAYEIERDRLPPVCVKCGRPTPDRLTRTMRIVDDPGRWGGFFFLTFLVSIFFFPPLLFVLLRWARAVRVNIPMCAADQARAARKEKVVLGILVPVWCLYVLAIDAVLVVGPLAHAPGWFCGIAGGFLLTVALVDCVHGWVRRRRGKAAGPGFTLPGVHAAFISAMVEDRARDRISNPDRRGGHGDVRDDFDDNAV